MTGCGEAGECRALYVVLAAIEKMALIMLLLPSVFFRLLDEAVRQIVYPQWLLRYKRCDPKKIDAAKETIDNYLEECIDQRLKENKLNDSNDSTGTDLLNILLNAESEGIIKRIDVKGQLLTFIFAGYDTLAPTLSYLLWEVSYGRYTVVCF